MVESILKSIASILVDAMFHVVNSSKWEECKAQILNYDSTVGNLSIRTALLSTYLAIERDVLSLDENSTAVQINEDILEMIGCFQNTDDEAAFSRYIDEEINSRHK